MNMKIFEKYSMSTCLRLAIAWLAVFFLCGIARAQETTPAEDITQPDVAVEETITQSDDPSAREVLQKAMERSQAASYCCDVDDRGLLFLAEAQEGTFWRLVLKDGFVCRKMELRDDQGQAVLILTQNREGSFAYAKGEWVKIMEIFPLYYFDHISSDLDDYEKSIAVFSQQTMSYSGRQQIRIRMDMTRDLKKLIGGTQEVQIGWGCKGTDDLESRYYSRRPMHRLFTIDVATGMIVSRFHYNVRKQKVYGRTMRHLILDPKISEKDFAPSGEVKKEYDCLVDQFLYRHFGDPQYRRERRVAPGRAYHRPSALEAWFRRMYATHGNLVLYVPLGALGILFLATALFLRRRRDSADMEDGK